MEAKKVKKAAKKRAPKATAVHIESDDGTAIVGIGNLRVMLSNDDGFWFAQGLEIDYAAQGSSVKDVQNRFELGLEATINAHLQIFGNIERLLAPAPPEVWKSFLAADCLRKRHSQVSVHKLNTLTCFEALEFFELKAA